MKTQAPGKPNLVRVLRRRLGLTQKELAYLVGYESDSQMSHIENGSRTPRLAEVLMIELVFGVPAVTVFPEVRQVVGQEMRSRVRSLLADIGKSALIESPRVSYKSAQLERVLASLKAGDEFNRGDMYL